MLKILLFIGLGLIGIVLVCISLYRLILFLGQLGELCKMQNISEDEKALDEFLESRVREKTTVVQ